MASQASHLTQQQLVQQLHRQGRWTLPALWLCLALQELHSLAYTQARDVPQHAHVAALQGLAGLQRLRQLARSQRAALRPCLGLASVQGAAMTQGLRQELRRAAAAPPLRPRLPRTPGAPPESLPPARAAK